MIKVAVFDKHGLEISVPNISDTVSPSSCAVTCIFTQNDITYRGMQDWSPSLDIRLRADLYLSNTTGFLEKTP